MFQVVPVNVFLIAIAMAFVMLLLLFVLALHVLYLELIKVSNNESKMPKLFISMPILNH